MKLLKLVHAILSDNPGTGVQDTHVVHCWDSNTRMKQHLSIKSILIA